MDVIASKADTHATVCQVGGICCLVCRTGNGPCIYLLVATLLEQPLRLRWQLTVLQDLLWQQELPDRP